MGNKLWHYEPMITASLYLFPSHKLAFMLLVVYLIRRCMRFDNYHYNNIYVATCKYCSLA